MITGNSIVTLNMDFINMKKFKTKYFIIGLVVSLSLICACIYIYFGDIFLIKWQSEEKRMLSINQSVGESFRKQSNVEKETFVDKKRYSQAAEILSNDRFDHEVVILYNLVVDNPSYGYTYQVQFIDESSDVKQINYRASLQESEELGVCFCLVPSGDVSGNRRYQGQYIQEFILRSSDEVIRATLEDPNLNEPPYLYLPREMYENVVKGNGEMLLLDSEGEVMDRLNLKIRQ